MNNTEVAGGGGIGLGTAVWIVLIVLKATGHIAMGWFWVLTSIIWAPIAIFFAIAGIILIFAVIVTVFKGL
jgi:hypothetical protein